MSAPLKFGPPCISVDVEDWPQSSWDLSLPISLRAAKNVRRVLELLNTANVRATMFVLGKFAEKHPSTVRDIQDAGHEIGSHGYGHLDIFTQSESAFREDIRRAKDLLEQAAGRKVIGYRAPNFSIVPKTLWALRILAEEGFVYDSSIFPVRHPRYGIPCWPTEPVRVLLPDGLSIHELPIATFHVLRTNWPVGGGGYHRLLPTFMIKYFARKILATRPFVFYCHPYEFDPRELKEIPVKLPFKVRLHQGLGRRWFCSRFREFLHEFGGRTIIDLVDSRQWHSVNVANIVHSLTLE